MTSGMVHAATSVMTASAAMTTKAPLTLALRCIRRAAVTLGLAAAGAALANVPLAPGADAPPLIAGRLAAADGGVLIWRAEESGAGQWDRAQLNDVVTVGTALAVEDGRAEVRVGPHALRLAGATSGSFSQLDFAAKTFNLERGVINLRLAAAQQGESVALLVGGVRVDFAAPGRYRIDAVDGSPLNVSVFEGGASVRYGSNALAVNSGQALLLTQSSINYAAVQGTAFDDWAWARDARLAQAAAARYVSPYMTGHEELDAWGEWINEPAYGVVWAPRAVPVGWAPYRDGRWRWVAPWGWTWVDAAPWGYAPFHYGRWVVVGGRWCWWPGGWVARPVWAPALVGFVGTTGVSVTVGGPVVGWYPLAPWQPFRPSYVVNNTYVTVINQTIINRPPQAVPFDVNQRAATWVPQPRFREPVAKVRLPARTEALADVQPSAPPPRPVRTGAVDGVPRAPGALPEPQRLPPKLALSPTPPLPGANPGLAQPAPLRPAPMPALPPAPGQLPEREQPRPKARIPPQIVPPYQQLQNPNPAEPARIPPAAPPTIRQPPMTVPPPRVSPPAAAPVTAAPAARTAPPAAAPHAAPTPKHPPAAETSARGGDARAPRTVQQER
jgi:hypothetical protein